MCRSSCSIACVRCGSPHCQNTRFGLFPCVEGFWHLLKTKPGNSDSFGDSRCLTRRGGGVDAGFVVRNGSGCQSTIIIQRRSLSAATNHRLSQYLGVLAHLRSHKHNDETVFSGKTCVLSSVRTISMQFACEPRWILIKRIPWFFRRRSHRSHPERQ
jgi:hypothetical protein